MELTANLNLNAIAGNAGAQGAAGTLFSLVPEGSISDVMGEKNPLSGEEFSADFALLMQRTISQLTAADIQPENSHPDPTIPKNGIVAIGDFMSDPYVGKDLRISCLVEKYFHEENIKSENIWGKDIVASFVTWEAAAAKSEANPLPEPLESETQPANIVREVIDNDSAIANDVVTADGKEETPVRIEAPFGLQIQEMISNDLKNVVNVSPLDENNKDQQEAFDNAGAAELMPLFTSVTSQPKIDQASEQTRDEHNQLIEKIATDQPIRETGEERKEYQSLGEEKLLQPDATNPGEQSRIIPGYRPGVKEVISSRKQVPEGVDVSTESASAARESSRDRKQVPEGVDVSIVDADMSHFRFEGSKHLAASLRDREQLSSENLQFVAMAEETSADANTAEILFRPHVPEHLSGPLPDREHLTGDDHKVAATTVANDMDVDGSPINNRQEHEYHQAVVKTTLQEKAVAGTNAFLFPDVRNGSKTKTIWSVNDRPPLPAAKATFEKPAIVTPILVVVPENDAEETLGKKTTISDAIKENFTGKYQTQTAGSIDDPKTAVLRERQDNGNFRIEKAVFMEGFSRVTEEHRRGPGKATENVSPEHAYRFTYGDIQNLRSDRPVTPGLAGENFPASSVMNQVRDGMVQGFKDGGRVRITLYPETLGRVDMDIVVRHDRVELVMKVDNEQVRQLLNSHVEDLKTTLQNQGWQVNGVDVTLQKDNNPADGRNFDHLFSWQERSNQDRQQGGMTGGNAGNPPAAGMVDPTPEATTKTEIKVKGLSIFA